MNIDKKNRYYNDMLVLSSMLFGLENLKNAVAECGTGEGSPPLEVVFLDALVALGEEGIYRVVEGLHGGSVVLVFVVH